MHKPCRGIACIINVYRVNGMKDRNGTNVDRDRLKEMLVQLHFDVRVFNDDNGLSKDVSYRTTIVLYVDLLCRSVCTVQLKVAVA